jgi:hypothetical protein
MPAAEGLDPARSQERATGKAAHNYRATADLRSWQMAAPKKSAVTKF